MCVCIIISFWMEKSHEVMTPNDLKIVKKSSEVIQSSPVIAPKPSQT